MKVHSTFFRTAPLLIITAAILVGLLGALPAAQDEQPPPSAPEVDQRWLDRLDELDRALLDENIGSAPPAITDEMKKDLTFLPAEGVDWAGQRGKVVVIQSWTTKTDAGRNAPARAAAALKDLNRDDWQIVAIHTPEGAENAEKFLERRPLDVPVIIDRSGLLLDELGIYRRPVNIIIDRNGVVRYAGLNPRGLQQAAAALAKEPFDPNSTPPQRDTPAAQGESDSTFPAVTGQVSGVRDLRGQRAPDFFVQQWLNGQPTATGKVVLVDFWATWCGPCVQSIPHLNDIAARYPRDMVVVGLSDEPISTISNFMRGRQMNYAVATDTTGRMKSAMLVSSIPQAVVISSDWIVRWQGHPTHLTPAILDQIVAANRTIAGRQQGGERYRWSRGSKG